jgi:ribonucleoside-diphosphate reductase alpha chain
VDAGLQLDLTEAAMERDIEAQVQAARFADASSNGSNGSNGSSGAAAPVTATVAAPAPAAVASSPMMSEVSAQTAAVQAMLADKMGDAPLCDTCGHITVRNGSCYRCLNCGESKGCS